MYDNLFQASYLLLLQSEPVRLEFRDGIPPDVERPVCLRPRHGLGSQHKLPWAIWHLMRGEFLSAPLSQNEAQMPRRTQDNVRNSFPRSHAFCDIPRLRVSAHFKKHSKLKLGKSRRPVLDDLQLNLTESSAHSLIGLCQKNFKLRDEMKGSLTVRKLRD